MLPSKCTSPPNAKVTGCPFPVRSVVVVVEAAVVVVGRSAGAVDGIDVLSEPDSRPPTTVAAPTAASTMAPEMSATRTGDCMVARPGQASARTTIAPV